MTNLARRVGLCYSLAAMFAATACDSNAAPTSPTRAGDEAASAAPGRIVVLGDSLAVSPSRTDNFPAALQRRLDSGNRRWSIVNSSVSGDTTAGGVRRFDAATEGGADILILELGANDGLRGVDTSAIERNIAAIIERAQGRGIQVLLCGMETPPLHGWDYTVEFHRIFPRLASRYDVPLVPFLLAGVALNPEMNGDDEIHPNAAGAQRIADTVWVFLQPMVEGKSTAAAGR
jgi:acyl-CoA thioesterase I